MNNSGSPDSNARFKIGMAHSLGTDNGFNYLTYNITSNNEAVVLCMIGSESSVPILFAGKCLYIIYSGTSNKRHLERGQTFSTKPKVPLP